MGFLLVTWTLTFGLTLSVNFTVTLDFSLYVLAGGIDPAEHGAKMEDRFYNNKAFEVLLLLYVY